jgi:hypothetical protein
MESVLRGENVADMVVEGEVWARSVVSALVKKQAEAGYLGRAGMADSLVADGAVDSACGDGWAVDEAGKIGCVGEEAEGAERRQGVILHI